MDVFGLRLSVLMFIENTLARITNEHVIIWSIWKMRSVELEALFRVRVRAAKTALSDLYLLALKLIRNILASIINGLVHNNLWACSGSNFFFLEWQGFGFIINLDRCGQGVLPINCTAHISATLYLPCQIAQDRNSMGSIWGFESFP